jgi:hypothetical protein
MPDSPQEDGNGPRKPATVCRALIEAGFIVFLYYSNLMMGEFEGSAQGRTRGFLWAIKDIFTGANIVIALVTAFVGYLVFELLRRKFEGSRK